MSANSLKICSLDELELDLSEDLRQHLSKQYPEDGSFDAILQAMKRPPATTICRVNQILASRDQVVDGLRQLLLNICPYVKVVEHADFEDVVCILPTTESTTTSNLFSSRVPMDGEILFPKWPSRKEKGWPMTHRVVLCDRFCGEAVLRGSDIFVRGVLAADANIQPGETVAVYADIRSPNAKPVCRGLLLDNYNTTTIDGSACCVFLGMGTTACSRHDFFRCEKGVAVQMSQDPAQRAGPCLPPLYGVLQDKMMLQNLPSIVVGHILDPKPHESILDMCCAPGGKSLHLASLVRNQATIVSCDKSRKKMVAAKDLFRRCGATCITPLALDSTNCVEREIGVDQSTTSRTVKEVCAGIVYSGNVVDLSLL
jgi:hypothetical protein